MEMFARSKGMDLANMCISKMVYCREQSIRLSNPVDVFFFRAIVSFEPVIACIHQLANSRLSF